MINEQDKGTYERKACIHCCYKETNFFGIIIGHNFNVSFV